MPTFNFEEALRLWQQQTPLPEGNHLLQRELQTLADRDDDDPAWAHLALCAGCRERLWQLKLEPSLQLSDSVLPLAADVGRPRQATWTTRDGKYSIELRRIVGSKHRAILMVRVKSTLNMEGKTLVVKDAYGQELLRDQVNRDGLVASEIQDIQTLALQELLIFEA